LPPGKKATAREKFLGGTFFQYFPNHIEVAPVV
jgi:hypothetical protein